VIDDPDVLVVGGGPAGRALAAATAGYGLRVTLIDPRPERPWRIRYGAWTADLPPDLPASVVAARARGRVVSTVEHALGWEYAMLDVPALRAHLDAAMAVAGVQVRAGRVVRGGPRAVRLDDGTTLHARVVADAAGRWRPLAPRPVHLPAEQTAYGLVVDQGIAAPLVRPGEALFMDWRRDHGEPGWPTFLYGIPLGGGRVLVEETSLARRPGLALPVLRRRLLARLARHGIVPPADAEVDRVRFPVDQPRHPGLGFGAAAPLVHPATGFSLAEALRLAPVVADALATHLPAGPGAALAAARRAVWPAPARAVHALRRIGLEAMLRMPPEDVPAFFAVFFALPARHRWAYLTSRTDLRGHAAAMAALYARAGWGLRARLVGPAVLPRLPANVD
jgi:lycopene beta-cyclase